jgi:small subunit ribosomal protein S6
MLVHSDGCGRPRPLWSALEEPTNLQSYEALILIEPDAEEERQEEIVARVREIVLGGGGSWDALDPWGRKKLAYEIEKHTEANHWMVQFSCDPAALAEVDRVLRITDGVLRHKTLRRKAA